jgi:hypothetical protein
MLQESGLIFIRDRLFSEEEVIAGSGETARIRFMISVGKYQRRSAKKPSVVTVSPGRVNLIGEHIDYLGGCVMPIAIDRHLT